MKNKSEFPKTLQQAILYFSDAENCSNFLSQLRWPNGVECPECSGREVSYLSTRRLWKCKACKKQFSVKVGSLMEDSPIGLDKWLAAIWLIANAKNGISSYEIHRALRQHVEYGSELMTDAYTAYPGLAGDYIHQFVNHTETYVRGRVHTNGIENFWSLLKRSIKGTYVSVEPFHLFRYLDEQTFRFNGRRGNDGERFQKVMEQLSGKRLTYAELTGKTPVDASTSH